MSLDSADLNKIELVIVNTNKVLVEEIKTWSKGEFTSKTECLQNELKVREAMQDVKDTIAKKVTPLTIKVYALAGFASFIGLAIGIIKFL